MGRTIHVHFPVRTLLSMERKAFKHAVKTFHDEQGRPLTVDQARSLLFDLLADGVECLPIGEPCEGFSVKTGCPGHNKPDDLPPEKQIELMAGLLKRKNEGELQ